jgi:Ca2+-binding EF-hand superfamily protein
LDGFISAVQKIQDEGFLKLATGCPATLKQRAEHIFREFDFDGSGHLDEDEFKRALFSMSACPFAPSGKFARAFHNAKNEAHATAEFEALSVGASRK